MSEYWYEVDRLTWQCRNDAIRRGNLNVAHAYAGLSFIAGHIWRLETYDLPIELWMRGDFERFIRDLAEFRGRLKGVEVVLL